MSKWINKWACISKGVIHRTREFMIEWIGEGGGEKKEGISKLPAQSKTLTCPSCLCPGVLAQLLCLLVGHIDVVEATEEGDQDDHEDEHEPGGGWDRGGSEQVSTLGEVKFWEEGNGVMTFQTQLFYLTSFQFGMEQLRDEKWEGISSGYQSRNSLSQE